MNNKVFSSVIDVTPEMAQNWLSHNPGNRPLSSYRVQHYVSAMKKGEWYLNGETIVIDSNGCLKNGQHRLAAIIKYGKPVSTVVVFGIDPSVNLFDRHGKRSVVDYLRTSSLPHWLANTQTVGCAYVDFELRGEFNATEDDVMQWVSIHEDAIGAVMRTFGYSCNSAGRVNTKFAPLMLAAIYAYESGVPENELSSFAESIKTGIISDTALSAAVILRNDLISRVIPKNGKARSNWVACCERAIYDYVHRTPRRKTYRGTTDHMYMWSANRWSVKEDA